MTLRCTESSGAVFGTGEEVLKSSWIQRLKIRDEMEPSKANGNDIAPNETHAISEDRKPTGITDEAGKALNFKNQLAYNSGNESGREENDFGTDEYTEFPKLGFGPWVNISSVTQLAKPIVASEKTKSKTLIFYGVSGAKQEHPKRLEDILEASKSNEIWNINNGIHALASSLKPAKPPLPPCSKLGLHLKPLSNQKSQTCISLPGNAAAMSSNKTGLGQTTLPSFIQDENVNRGSLPDSPDVKAVVKSKTVSMADRQFASGWNANDKPSRVVNHVLCGKTYCQWVVTCNKDVVQDLNAYENTGTTQSGICKPISIKAGELPYNVTTYSPEQTNQHGENSGANTAGIELRTSTFYETPPQNSLRTSSEVTDGAPTSSTAKFAWEMLEELADASKQAREQFVEVYNEAREELKNQKATSVHKKTMRKEAGENQGQAILREGFYGGRDLKASQFQQQSSRLCQQQGKTLDGFMECKSEIPIMANEGLDYLSKQTQTANMQKIIKLHKGNMKSSAGMQEHECLSTVHGDADSKAIHAISQTNCSSQTSEVANQNNILPHRSSSILGKRPRAIFEDFTSSIVQPGSENKVSISCRERPIYNPLVWLQRWHPTILLSKSPRRPEHIEVERTGQEGVGSCVGVWMDCKNGRCHKLTERCCTMKGIVSEKGRVSQMVERKEGRNSVGSVKILPSAAAMAIVGTTARQFCVAPQRKGSFAFWSGFGLQAGKKTCTSNDKGKEKIRTDSA